MADKGPRAEGGRGTGLGSKEVPLIEPSLRPNLGNHSGCMGDTAC